MVSIGCCERAALDDFRNRLVPFANGRGEPARAAPTERVPERPRGLVAACMLVVSTGRAPCSPCLPHTACRSTSIAVSADGHVMNREDWFAQKCASICRTLGETGKAIVGLGNDPVSPMVEARAAAVVAFVCCRYVLPEDAEHMAGYLAGSGNGMENFWSLVKRALKGTYVSVEPFHLFRYSDEEVFRFNSRKMTDPARFAIAAVSMFGTRLTFKQITAADATC